MRQGRRAGRTTVVAVLAGMCALAGCSSSHDAAHSHNTTSSTPAKQTTSSSAATSGAASTVLTAYRASWSAFEQALADANPNAPTLAATMVDPQLQGVKANLLSDQIHGMIGQGTFTLHPKILRSGRQRPRWWTAPTARPSLSTRRRASQYPRSRRRRTTALPRRWSLLVVFGRSPSRR